MKIVADNHIPYVADYFSAYGNLVLKSGRGIRPEDVKDADILLVRSITRVDQALLADSKVKFVASITAGADHLDTKWLEEAGIMWSNARGFNAPPVADYVVSVIAALQRKEVLPQQRLRAAVVGVGNVGKLVVERLKCLNFEVVVCDPLRALQEADFSSTQLSELADFDLISVHVPLTRSGPYPTHHFIDADFLKRQKPGCVLLNASRGAVINTHDLIQYSAQIYCCLDVWEHEPRIDKTLLERAFIATPHIAGYSIQSKIRGIDMVYQIACERNIIRPQFITPIAMPRQQLSFAGATLHWQDVALASFNPILLTAMMRTQLLPADNEGQCFDEMRNKFNYRHEFAYTDVSGAGFSSDDMHVLQQLGVNCVPSSLFSQRQR